MARQALIAACLMVLLIAISSFAIDSGPAGEFNVTPDHVWLNWTNNYRANITIGAKTNLSVAIHNTTFIVGNYSQRQFFLKDKYKGKYWNDNAYDMCFGATSSRYDNPLLVQNSSGAYTNETGLMLNNTQKNMTLIHYVLCPPGRYFGNVLLFNSTNSSEAANITVTIDVLISTANELDNSTGIGVFKGRLPSNEHVHSYFFNTSNITNATGVYVNLSWSSEDIDLFLLGPELKTGSRGKANYEGLRYSYLPAHQIWEIRLCGNLSSDQDYTGYLSFTTLNATNSSGRVDLIDFGNINTSQNKSFFLTLRNEGGLKPTVSQSIELWHTEKRNDSRAANFTFLVPEAATSVKAILEWNGDTNYSLYLYNPSGNLVNYSVNKHIPSMLCNVTKQEWTEATAQEGFWRVEVENHSASSPYNLTFIFYVNAGNWISTNFTQMTFNSSGQPNSSQSFVVNLTANKGLPGIYAGNLLYSLLNVPLRFNLTAGTLLVNGSLKQGTVTVKDNIGFNRTGDDLSIEIALNNTGNEAINLTAISSPSLKYGSYYANFSYSLPQNLTAGGSGTLRINITINTSNTQNRAGIYTGWLYIDGNASPYDGFNLTLRLNLTDRLKVDVTELKTADGNQLIENTSRSENVTVKVKAYYINGTQIACNQFNLSNFTAWLWHPNASFRSPSSDSLSIYKGADPWCISGSYTLNITIPANLPGGTYRLNVKADKHINPTLTGTGYNASLTINDTGLYLTRISSLDLGSINEGGNYTYFIINVTNYGYRAAKGIINMSDCSYAHPRANEMTSGCGTFNADNSYFNIDIDPNGTETCQLKWKITSVSSVSEDKSCSFSITTSDKAFNNITGISLTVNNVEAAQQQSQQQQQQQQQQEEEEEEVSYNLSITDYPQYLQLYLGNSTNSTVKVKNTGDVSMQVEVEVDINSGIIANITPSSQTISAGSTGEFILTLTVLNTSELGNHSGTIMAKKSDNASIYDSVNFVVEVLATKEKKQELNTSFANYSAILSQLKDEFEKIKAGGFVPTENITRLESLFNQSSDLLSQIENALKNKDYATAEDLVEQLSSVMQRIEDEMAVVKQAQQANISFIWTVAGIVIACLVVAGLIIYMFLPPKTGYTPGAGYRHPSPSKIEKIKRFLKKIRKPKEKKEKAFVYRYRG